MCLTRPRRQRTKYAGLEGVTSSATVRSPSPCTTRASRAATPSLAHTSLAARCASRRSRASGAFGWDGRGVGAGLRRSVGRRSGVGAVVDRCLARTVVFASFTGADACTRLRRRTLSGLSGSTRESCAGQTALVSRSECPSRSGAMSSIGVRRQRVEPVVLAVEPGHAVLERAGAR